MMFGAVPGIVLTLGWKSTPHNLDGALRDVIFEQKDKELGFNESQTYPYPLEPIVM